MNGLPRAKDVSRPRDVFSLMVLGGIERTVEALRRGDAFDGQSLIEMRQLCNRYASLDHALKAREALIEDEE